VTFSYLLRFKKMPRSHDFHFVVRICEISFIILNVSFIGSPICLYLAFETLQGQAQHNFWKATSLTFVALKINPSEYIHGLRDLIKSIVIEDVCLQVAETVALSS
jgi:hypothetical protein